MVAASFVTGRTDRWLGVAVATLAAVLVLPVLAPRSPVGPTELYGGLLVTALVTAAAAGYDDAGIAGAVAVAASVPLALGVLFLFGAVGGQNGTPTTMGDVVQVLGVAAVLGAGLGAAGYVVGRGVRRVGAAE